MPVARMGENLPQLVGADLADKGALAAQRRESGHGVGSRTARTFDGWSHAFIQCLAAHLVDQRHRSLDQILAFQEAIVGGGKNIDNGVADTDDVERRHIWSFHQDRLKIRPGSLRT